MLAFAIDFLVRRVKFAFFVDDSYLIPKRSTINGFASNSDIYIYFPQSNTNDVHVNRIKDINRHVCGQN